MTDIQNRMIAALTKTADYLGQLPTQSKGAELRKEIIGILDTDLSSPEIKVSKSTEHQVHIIKTTFADKLATELKKYLDNGWYVQHTDISKTYHEDRIYFAIMIKITTTK